jgi:hypothetical protein
LKQVEAVVQVQNRKKKENFLMYINALIFYYNNGRKEIKSHKTVFKKKSVLYDSFCFPVFKYTHKYVFELHIKGELNKKKKLISINDILINSKFVSLQTLINT